MAEEEAAVKDRDGDAKGVDGDAPEDDDLAQLMDQLSIQDAVRLATLTLSCFLSLAPSLSLAHSLSLSLSRSLTHSLSRSLTHSLAHSLALSTNFSRCGTPRCFAHDVSGAVMLTPHTPLLWVPVLPVVCAWVWAGGHAARTREEGGGQCGAGPRYRLKRKVQGNFEDAARVMGKRYQVHPLLNACLKCI